MLTTFRYILFPFSVLYGVVVFLRNKLFDYQLLSSESVAVKTICIGNLSVGGTGKTPHTEYIAKLLYQLQIPTAILSRGYGRKSKGFIAVSEVSTAIEVGDEPLQMRNNLPTNILNFVCENRVDGINTILASNTKISCVVLDDAFQHRKLRCGLNILLTDYNSPFYSDNLLPTGNLRDIKQSAKRANLIIVTKCAESFDESKISKSIRSYSSAPIFFSHINYSENLIHFSTKKTISLLSLNNLRTVVVTGIANPTPFIQYIESKTNLVKHFEFNDHHSFTDNDIKNIVNYYTKLNDNSLLITTQKDAMRLQEFLSIKEFNELPLYYLPIEITFGQKDASLLTEIITQYVRKN